MTVLRTANDLILEYLDWQAERFQSRESEDGRVFINTPFSRADGHLFEIEVCFLKDGSVRFTDAGETLDELWMQGVALTGSTLEDIRRIAFQFRVTLSEGDHILANHGEGGARQLQDLMSTIFAVSALHGKPTTSSSAQW